MSIKLIYDQFKAAVIIVAIIALCLPGIPAAAEGNTIVSLSTPSQPISPGSQFTISINIQPNNAIAGAQFTLSFNPSLVTLNSVSEGNLLNQNGASTFFGPGQINNSAGTITGVAGTIVDPGYTVASPGTFAVITLTAGSMEGTCPLTLSKVIVGDINAQKVPISTVNGNIAITSNSINLPPILEPIGDKTVNPGSPLTILISATDPNGDQLNYSAFNLPSGAIFNSATRSLTWIPGTNDIATYPDVGFEATDGTLSDLEVITITVATAPFPGGGGGGGGGGGAAPAPIPAPSPKGITGGDGLFNQTVSIKSDDGLAEIVIDQGTIGLASDGKIFNKIYITEVESPETAHEQPIIVGTVYYIEPDGAKFDRPINLKLTYIPALIPAGTNENDLIIVNWDALAGKWINLESQVNLTNHTVTSRVNHFSVYAIMVLGRPEGLEQTDQTIDVSQPDSFTSVKIDLDGSGVPQILATPTPSVVVSPILVAPVDAISNAQSAPNVPAEKEFSLSLLAEMVGGAIILIVATTLLIVVRRRRLLGRGQIY